MKLSSVQIIFGEEQTNKYLSQIPFTKEEIEIHIKEYFFSSEIELNAFLKGIDEAIGWMECYIIQAKTV